MASFGERASDLAKRVFLGSAARRSSSPMEAAGSVGDAVDASGYVVSNERTPSLVGKERYRRYSEILANTVMVATAVRYFLLLVSSSEWTVEPASNEEGEPLPGAEDVATFVKEVMRDMETPWARVVRRAALFRFHGFSLQEWTAKKRDDGRIGLLDIEPRPQGTIDRWDMDRGKVMGVVQWTDNEGEMYIPRGKLVYFVDDSLHESPEGLGLFRHVARAAERLQAYEELEELAFETDLRGTPVGRVPLEELRDAVTAGNMTAVKALAARAAVDSFVRNRLRNKNKGVVLDAATFRNLDEAASPSPVRKYDVELLRGEAPGQTEVAGAIQRVNQEIARLFGVEHLMLGSDGTGSLALGQTKLSNFFLVVTSTQTDLSEGFERDMVRPVCELNGIPQELWPTLKPEEIDMTDVEALGQLLSDLASAGAPLMPGDPAVDTIRARVGLPPAPEVDPEDLEDAMLGGRKPGEPPPKPGDDPEVDIEPGTQTGEE